MGKALDLIKFIWNNWALIMKVINEIRDLFKDDPAANLTVKAMEFRRPMISKLGELADNKARDK